MATSENNGTMAGWHHRVAEQAQQIAGLFAALQSYQDDSLTITMEQARAGIALADWHGAELSRVDSFTMDNEAANDAQAAWQAIGHAVRTRSSATPVSQNVEGQWQANIRNLLIKKVNVFRKNPDRRDAAIYRLEIDGLISPVPGKKSQWLVHPQADLR